MRIVGVTFANLGVAVAMRISKTTIFHSFPRGTTISRNDATFETFVVVLKTLVTITLIIRSGRTDWKIWMTGGRSVAFFLIILQAFEFSGDFEVIFTGARLRVVVALQIPFVITISARCQGTICSMFPLAVVVIRLGIAFQAFAKGRRFVAVGIRGALVVGRVAGLANQDETLAPIVFLTFGTSAFSWWSFREDLASRKVRVTVGLSLTGSVVSMHASSVV